MFRYFQITKKKQPMQASLQRTNNRSFTNKYNWLIGNLLQGRSQRKIRTEAIFVVEFPPSYLGSLWWLHLNKTLGSNLILIDFPNTEDSKWRQNTWKRGSFLWEAAAWLAWILINFSHLQFRPLAWFELS